MKLNRKIFLINVLIALSILVHLTILGDPKGAQKSPYPNEYQPATSTAKLKTANFKAPLMSQALREILAHRRLRKSDFLEVFKYGMYHLTRGETEQMFNFIDQNKDDMIDMGEWGAFVQLFIMPFEACDMEHNYLLEPKEFKICFDKDPKTKVVTFRRRHEKEKYNLMMDVLSTRGRSVINFSDYLFLRKALFGWQNCHSSNKYIALSQFKCAFRESLPQKYQIKYHYEKIYFVGKRLANDRNLIQLDFISYLRTLHFAYVFSIIGMPHDTPVIEKSQFVKAIREDRIPMNINEEEVNIWYDLIDSTPFKINKIMSFETFAFFYNYHRIFYKYNMEKPLQISKDEVLKSLNDNFFPEEVLQAIDVSTTSFTEPQYLEVSNIVERLRLNERDFYIRSFLELPSKEEKKEKFRFKQDASMETASLHNKTTINNKFWDRNVNKNTRSVYFDTMTGMDKKYWTQDIWYKAAMLTNFFVCIHGIDEKFWLIGSTTLIEEIPKHWETCSPVMGLSLRKNYNYYKMLPREIQLDLLDFLALEFFESKVNIHKNDNNDQINESLLKIILKDYGMINMPDTVLDLGMTGNDVLGRRLYNPKETLIHLITVHAAAGDDIRSKVRIGSYNLKKNTDPTRSFTGDSGKRFFASPLV
ncbi:MAG: hypothetical protein RIR51_847 [Bacteroidota bacterium]|jgi:hypothetical protein